MTTRTTDVIVLGDGALGLALADTLATQAPDLSVTVFAGRIFPAASRAAGAMIAPWSETTARGRERLGHQVHVQWADGAQRSSPVLLAEFPQVAGSG